MLACLGARSSTTVLRNAWALLLGMLLLMIANSLQSTLLGVVFAMRYGMVAVSTTAEGFRAADTATLVIAVSLGAIVLQYPIV